MVTPAGSFICAPQFYKKHLAATLYLDEEQRCVPEKTPALFSISGDNGGAAEGGGMACRLLPLFGEEGGGQCPCLRPAPSLQRWRGVLPGERVRFTSARALSGSHLNSRCIWGRM